MDGNNPLKMVLIGIDPYPYNQTPKIGSFKLLLRICGSSSGAVRSKYQQPLVKAMRSSKRGLALVKKKLDFSRTWEMANTIARTNG
jgi:hypothetical protein